MGKLLDKDFGTPHPLKSVQQNYAIENSVDDLHSGRCAQWACLAARPLSLSI